MTHPLFEPADDGLPVQLRIGRCGACGHAFFPPQTLGCERCGAHGEALDEALVPAAGTVHSAITVWRHRGPGIEAPFRLADVLLDGGVALRALLDGASSDVPSVGARVVGRTLEPGDSLLPGLRFVVEAQVSR
ncbi:MAG: hypothetical protein IT503_10235 [Burkholderiaceae bacterium]|nr:hypothetical protein [Burkholderiaceae bacterium]